MQKKYYTLKLILFITILFLCTPNLFAQGENILSDNQYKLIEGLNQELFEKLQELSYIQFELAMLLSDGSYNDIYFNSAFETITLALNLWAYEFRFVKWTPCIKGNFLFDYLCELDKSLTLVNEKTTRGLNFIRISIFYLSQNKFNSSLDKDVLKTFRNAQNTLEAGINIIGKISTQISFSLKNSKDDE